VSKALEASLKDLGVEYLDLYLMYWPAAFARGSELIPRDGDGKIRRGDTDFVETYKAMETLVKGGKVRAIGVSNFSKGELERLLKETIIISLRFSQDCLHV
jgi:diketogulonate reductase-like aldo/keto reductase